MKFEARELKPYAQPVKKDELVTGEVYFSVQFTDKSLTIPVIGTWVFVGENILKGDEDLLYFQDIDSYSNGVRHENVDTNVEGTLQTCSAKNPNHFFTFERALELLMACSLRRRTDEGAEKN